MYGTVMIVTASEIIVERVSMMYEVIDEWGLEDMHGKVYSPLYTIATQRL